MKNVFLFVLIVLFASCSKEVSFRDRPYSMVRTLMVKYQLNSFDRGTATFTGQITYKAGEVTDHGFVWASEGTFAEYPNKTLSSPLSKSISLGIPNLGPENTFTHTVEYIPARSNGTLGWLVWAYVKSNGFTYYGPAQFLNCCTR